MKYLQNHKFSEHTPVLIAIGFLLIYILGIFWPDIFWSTHFLAFLPASLKFSIPLFILLLILYTHFRKFKNTDLVFKLNTLSILIICGLTGLIFYNLDIINDYYGDAKNFAPYMDQKFTGFKKDYWKDLFSIQFKTGHARWGVFNLYSAISYFLTINMYQTFKLMDAFFGAGFVLLWLLAIRKYSNSSLLTIILTVLGCTAPVVLIFCGHIETYGFVHFLQLSWLYVFVEAFKKKKILLLWLCIPLLIICVRFNTPSLMFFPALILGLIYHYSGEKIDSFFTAKKMFLNILFPLILFGFIVYFFIVGDYNDSRVLNSDSNDIDRLFLPLLSPKAPLDTYNLLSWNHISDFIMVLFFLSPGLLFLIVISLVYRKKMTWDIPLINILLLTLVLLLGFLFMINPLMSLPMDWDLYTLPFPLVLMILLLVFQKTSEPIIGKKIAIFTLSLHLLSVPVFIVMMNKTMHSYRIESVGIRVYKTYYLHSDSYMLYALQMLEGKERYAFRKEALLKKLKPHVRGNIDQNYAALLLDEGINAFVDKNYIRSRELLLYAESYAPNLKLTQEFLVKANNEWVKGDFPVSVKNQITADSLISQGLVASRKNKFFETALRDFQRASYYDPYSPKIVLFQMETYFFQKEYQKALKSAKHLIKLKYPTEQESLRFGIHCALEAEKYENAKGFAKTYVDMWPEDEFLKIIYERLENNDSVSELKYKFVKK